MTPLTPPWLRAWSERELEREREREREREQLADVASLLDSKQYIRT